MNKPDMYMPLILGDFFKDTTRLDTEQQGAYLLLMIEFWLRGPLPSDEKTLQKICKFSPHKWAKKSREILEIFSEENGRLVHRNLMRMRSEYLARHKALSDAGRTGGLKNRQAKQKPGLSEASEKSDASLKQSYSYSETSNNSLPQVSKDSDSTAPAGAAAPDETGGEGADVVVPMIRHLLTYDAGIDPETPTAKAAIAAWRAAGVDSGGIKRAIDIARRYKTTGRINLNYLKTIVTDQIANQTNKIGSSHAKRTVPAERLTPAEIVANALRAESAAGGFVEGGCEIVH